MWLLGWGGGSQTWGCLFGVCHHHVPSSVAIDAQKVKHWTKLQYILVAACPAHHSGGVNSSMLPWDQEVLFQRTWRRHRGRAASLMRLLVLRSGPSLEQHKTKSIPEERVIKTTTHSQSFQIIQDLHIRAITNEGSGPGRGQVKSSFSRYSRPFVKTQTLWKRPHVFTNYPFPHLIFHLLCHSTADAAF